MWLKKDAKMGGGMWTVTHCSLCNQEQTLAHSSLSSGMEEGTRTAIFSSDDKTDTRKW
jgi:hypothetical protein